MKTPSVDPRGSDHMAKTFLRTAALCSLSSVLCLGLLVIGGVLYSSSASADSFEVCSGYGACSVNGYTTHGYEAHAGVSYWNMDAGNQCTNYVAYVESAVYGVPTPGYNLGNGGDWAANAAAHGVMVNNVPTVGAVAEWNGGEPGLPPPGHVAVVEAVGPDDSYIVISQQHIAADPGGYDWMQIAAGSQSWEPWPDHFIHFLPYKTTAGAVQTPDDGGYWVAETDGEVSHYGDAGFLWRCRQSAPRRCRSSEWRRPPTERATGSSARTAASSTSVMRGSTPLPGTCASTRRSSEWRDSRWKGLLARRLGRRHLQLR